MGVLGEGGRIDENPNETNTFFFGGGGDRNPINFQWTTRWIGMLRLLPRGCMQLATFPGSL